MTVPDDHVGLDTLIETGHQNVIEIDSPSGGTSKR